MADNSFMAFKCLNPECGKIIKLRRPEKSGIYAVACPHCGIKKNLKLKGLDAEPTAQAPRQTPPPLPDNSAKAPVVLTDDFLAGTPYKITCPHCQKQEISINIKDGGKKGMICPACRGKIAILVREPTKLIQVTEQLQLIKGKLIQLNRLFHKTYHLPPGRKTVVGRFDESQMSDISIKNDSSMSRRSIEIDVAQTMKGYTFKLSVLNATNPVLINGHPLMPGESEYLNYGDLIILGKTKFRFEKDL